MSIELERGVPRQGTLTEQMAFSWSSMLMLGIVLRWVMLDATSLWYDEGFTWWVATQSPARIIEIIRADTWPPLYYLLMHYWIAAFGDSVWAMRALSALAATVGLGLSIVLSRLVFKANLPRTMAVALLVFSAIQIRYAHDVRCYATATVLLLGTTIGIAMRLTHGRGRLWLVLYVFMATALVYQHNVMWLYLAWLQVAWLLWPADQRPLSRLKDMFIANAAIAVIFAPWAPSFIAQFRSVSAAFWTQRPSTYELTKVVASISGADSDLLRLGAQSAGYADQADRLMRWPAFMIVVAAIFASIILVRGASRRKVLALLAIGLGPVFMAYLYSQYRQSIFIERVFVPSSVFIAIALAALTETAGRWRRAAFVLSAVIVALAVTTSALALRYQHEDPWRQAMEKVQATAGPDDRVLFFAAEGELMYWYYREQMNWSPAVTGGVPHDFLATYPPHVQVPVRSERDLQPLRDRLARENVKRIIFIDSHAADLQGYSRVQHMFKDEWHATKLFAKDPITIWVCER